MKPLLYYRPGTCALSEIITLEWIGEPYRLCRLTAEQCQSEAFAALNPGRTVPVMRFAEGVVYENNALLAHLADTHPDLELAPRPGTFERALLEQWLAYLDSGFHAAHFPFFKPVRFLEDEALHDTLRETAKSRIGEHLARLEAHVAGREFMLGNRRSVVDAYMVAMARWARRFRNYAADFPELHRYLEAMDRDPGVMRAKAIESSDPPAAAEGLAEHVPFEL